MPIRIRFLLPILLPLIFGALVTGGMAQTSGATERRVAQALAIWKGGDTQARLGALRRLNRLGPRAASAVVALIPGLKVGDPEIEKQPPPF
jgi:hypothetical protein